MNDKEIPIESFFTILVIIGFLIKVFFNKLFSGPKSGMTIGGYGVVMVAIAGLLFYKISKDDKYIPNILLSKMSDTFIYLIVMILLAVVIFLNSKYEYVIDSEKLENFHDYDTITGISTAIFILQTYVLFKIYNDSLKGGDSKAGLTKVVSLVLASVNAVFVWLTYDIFTNKLTCG